MGRGFRNRAATGGGEAMAIAMNPLAMAEAQLAAGRLAEAEAACRGVLATQPRHPQALHLLGGIALRRGLADEAIDLYRQATAAAPRHPALLTSLAAALLARNMAKEAAAALKTAIKLDPRYAPAQVNMGDALLKLGRPHDAFVSLKKAVTLAPGDAVAHTNLGAALLQLKRTDEAVRVLERAIALDPGLAQAHDNLGVAYHSLGRLEEARACHTRALELLPALREAVVHRSGLNLALGRFEEGWRDYLERPSVRGVSLPLHRQPLPADLAGRRILLGKDQGLGDEIMFLRFAPALKRRGATVTYLAGGKIASLLRRLPFLDAVVGEEALGATWDMVLSVGDLPYLLGMTSAAEIPPSIRLPVIPDCLAAQTAALQALGPAPYVGVTWRGGLQERDKLLKIAPLEQMGGVLRQAGGTLIALQRAPERGEIARLAKIAGRPVHDFTALNDRLEDMLALLALLDDYVGVSNTNVHLRATLGKASRVLVPSPPEFRWMAAGTPSPWFPDCPIYRQEAGGSWDRALADLARDLVASLGPGPA